MADSVSKFLRGKATEHNGVNSADSHASVHSDEGFGDHWHVNDHTVALLDALVSEDLRETSNLILKRFIGDGAGTLGEGALVVDGDVLSVASLDVSINAIVGHVGEATSEPSVERSI